MIPFVILAIENEEDRLFMTDLYLNYRNLMYKEILKILHNKWDTEDVLQSTLIKLIDKIPELKTKESTKLINYVITACKNNSYNYLRDHKKEVFCFDDYENICDSAQEEQVTELRLIAEEEIAHLIKHWPDLDEKNRFLLEGKYVLGKTDEELAVDLHIKPASVRMALTRARNSAYLLMTTGK